MLSRITISAFLFCALGLLPVLCATGCGPAPASRRDHHGVEASEEPRCGNGIQEGDEIGDGDDLDGERCDSMGYGRGVIDSDRASAAKTACEYGVAPGDRSDGTGSTTCDEIDPDDNAQCLQARPVQEPRA